MVIIPAVHLPERAGKLRQTEKDGAGPALSAHGAHCGAHWGSLHVTYSDFSFRSKKPTIATTIALDPLRENA